MLFPKKAKFRKWQKARVGSRRKGRSAARGVELSFGSFGLKTMSLCRLRSNQIESARKVLSRATSKGGKMWIRVFPDRPYTQKAAEVGMGKGKGDVEGYEVEVYPGRIIFEVDGIPEESARDALRRAGAKLPANTRVISR